MVCCEGFVCLFACFQATSTAIFRNKKNLRFCFLRVTTPSTPLPPHFFHQTSLAFSQFQKLAFQACCTFALRPFPRGFPPWLCVLSDLPSEQHRLLGGWLVVNSRDWSQPSFRTIRIHEETPVLAKVAQCRRFHQMEAIKRAVWRELVSASHILHGMTAFNTSVTREPGAAPHDSPGRTRADRTREGVEPQMCVHGRHSKVPKHFNTFQT